MLKGLGRVERSVSNGPLRALFVAALALVVGCSFVGTNLLYNHGHLSAPLDDVFIHLQYGRQIGEGHPLQYNTADPPSTGASSLLYVIVLGAAYALGFHGVYLLYFAIGLGTLLLAATAVLGYALGRRLGGESVGLWGGALIATNGAFAWGATSGMEVALFAALLMGTLVAFLDELSTERFVLTPLLAALTALTRPEGTVFAAVLTGAVLLTLLRDPKRRSAALRKLLPVSAYSLLPVAAAAAQLALYKLVTGTSAANGLQAKSLLYLPVFYPTEFLYQTFSNLRELLLNVLGGLDLAGYLLPGAALAFAFGAAFLIHRGEHFRTFALATAIGLGLALSSIATLHTWAWNHDRYALPLFPVLLVFAVVGFYALVGSGRAWLPMALVVFALTFSLVGLPVWAATMGKESATIRDQQVSVGNWIRTNLPQNARVGINDAGAIRYYGGRPVVDLIGLVTDGLALPRRNGVGSTYEALERMPPGMRPTHFAIYPSWFKGLDESGVLGKRLKSFALPGQVSGDEGGREVIVYEADWGLAHSGDLPQTVPEGRIKDALDVADLSSEHRHGYEMRQAQVGFQPDDVLEKLSSPNGKVSVDGGRRISGSEAFTVRDLAPDRPATILMRTTSEEPFDLRVLVDGRFAGRWTFKSTGKDWQEPSFTIPAPLIRNGSARIELLPPDGGSYAPFHYWLVQ